MFPSRMTPMRLAAVVLACLSGLLVAAAMALADGEDDTSFGTGGTAFALLFSGDDDAYPLGSPYVDQGADGAVYQGTLTEVEPPPVVRGGSAPRDFELLVTRSSSVGVADPAYGGGGSGAASFPLAADYARLLDVRVLEDGRVVAAIAVVGLGDGGGTGTTTGTTDTTVTATEPLEQPETRGVPADQGLLLVTFPAGGAGGDAELTPTAPACDLAIAAEVDAAGEATILWHWCDGPDVVGRTADDKRTPLPGRFGYDLTLGPDESAYVLADDSETTEVRGANSNVDTTVVKLTPALDLAPGYQGPDHPFDGAPVDISVDGQGRAAVWYQPVLLTRLATTGRWTIGRLNADGTPDTGWGADGVATFEGEEFQTPTPHTPWGWARDGCFGDEGMASVVDQCRIWQLKSMAEGRVLVSGPPYEATTGRGSSSSAATRWTLARLDADGEHDATWDDDGTGTPPAGDGVKTVAFEGNEAGDPSLLNVGTPDLQSDRKVLLPFTALDFGGSPERIADFDAPVVVGVERMNVTPTPPPPTDTGTDTGTGTTPPPVQTQASQTPPAAAPPKPVVVASRSCTSRREFKIRLRTGRKKGEKSPIVTADVRVNGKKVSVSREARRRSVVNLKNLPKGRFSVTIRLVLKDGGVVRETRRYRTCTKKIERELGPLRTSPPRTSGK